MRFETPIGRRTFLRASGWSAGMLALSQLRTPGGAGASTAAVPGTVRVLSAGDARIMTAIAERMTFTGDPSMPRFSDTGGLSVIDTALLQTPPEVSSQLHWGLLLFQYGPPLLDGKLSTFTGLDEAAQDEYLTGWEHSRFDTCRLAFIAFKNLSMLGYYAQDATWKGIRYDGPWVPRPRRVVLP